MRGSAAVTVVGNARSLVPRIPGGGAVEWTRGFIESTDFRRLTFRSARDAGCRTAARKPAKKRR
jgi:hypothetical protein